MRSIWYVRGFVVLFCFCGIGYSIAEIGGNNLAYLPINAVIFTLLFDMCRTIESESKLELTIGNLGSIIRGEPVIAATQKGKGRKT